MDASRSHGDKLSPIGPSQKCLSGPRWCVDSEADEHCQPKLMAIIENRVFDSDAPPLDLTHTHPYPTAGQSDAAIMDSLETTELEEKEENLTISIC